VRFGVQKVGILGGEMRSEVRRAESEVRYVKMAGIRSI